MNANTLSGCRAVLLGVAVVAISTVTASASPRDVQITSVDTVAGIVTITNFGTTDEPLGSWRLCTADDNETFKYSTGGLSGRTIEAGTTFRFHFQNDAPGGDLDAVNVAALGGTTAGPLDNGPYGLALYSATPFFTASNMADYIQWTDDLANPQNVQADARANTAVVGGLWSSPAAWVVTLPDTTNIEFVGDTSVVLDDPLEYEVTNGISNECPADFDDNGVVGFADLDVLLGDWGTCGPCTADFDENGSIGFMDLNVLLDAWGPCP